MKPSAFFVALLVLAALVGCQETGAPTDNQTPPTPASNQVPSDTNPESAALSTTKPAADNASPAAPSTSFRFQSATDSGLEFQHVAGRSKEKFMPETMAAGRRSPISIKMGNLMYCS